MSIQAVAQVLDFELADPSAKLILIGIANHTSPNGHCFPSVRLLMRYSGLAESTVREKIRQLEEQKLIEVERTPGKSSIYRLTLPLQRPDHPPPDSGPPPLRQPDPNHNKNRKEPSCADAREGLPEDWGPSEKLRRKLDKDYPEIDIDEQARLFVLQNNAKGTLIAKPDAAFEIWMARAPQLKVPAKARTPAPSAGRDPRDPASRALACETEARWKRKLRDFDQSSEQWLAASRAWLACHGGDKDAQRCAATARGVAKAGSWAEEHANAFIAGQWGENFLGVPDYAD